MNDFILKPRLRSPIAVAYSSPPYTQFDIYTGDFNERTINGTTYYCQDNNLVPYSLRMSYIAKPAKVVYRADVGGNNVDCDLPEYLHSDVVKRAVDLYNQAVTGSRMVAQQNAQQNTQSNTGETTTPQQRQ